MATPLSSFAKYTARACHTDSVVTGRINAVQCWRFSLITTYYSPSEYLATDIFPTNHSA